MKYESWLFGKDGALFQAAATGSAALVDELLADGADANAASRNGYTPLHRAAQNGHLEVVRKLLAHAAARDARTADGNRPADLARRNGHADIVKLLEPPA